MHKLITVMAVTLFATAASAEIGQRAMASVVLTKPMTAAAEDALRNLISDPGSAQFRHLRGFLEASGSITVCGEVDVKNGFGGYVGFLPFEANIAPAKHGYIGAAIMASSEYGVAAFYETVPVCIAERANSR